MLTNLFTETLATLVARGKTSSEVRWVGIRSANGETTPVGTWEVFAHHAMATDYNDGFGRAVINRGLVIVGDDWWLERGEYDGSEWWAFKSLPRAPAVTTPLLATDIKDEW